MRGFWSYARKDDTTDKVSALRREFERLLTEALGDDVTLYHDSTHNHWGEVWQARIDAELERADFVISVVTPWYLNRNHCRHEFLEARRRGIQIFPLYYRTAPLIDNGSARNVNLKSNDEGDVERAEVASAIRRLQLRDFRRFRNDDLARPASQEFIDAMAEDILRTVSP